MTAYATPTSGEQVYLPEPRCAECGSRHDVRTRLDVEGVYRLVCSGCVWPCDTCGGEFTTGDIPLDGVPFDYVALGHLHRPQEVPLAGSATRPPRARTRVYSVSL